MNDKITRRPGESYTAFYERSRGHSDEATRIRKQGGVQARISRTIAWGSLAVLLALIYLAFELDLDRDELWSFFGTSLMFVAIPAVLGITAGGLAYLIGRRLRRPPSSSQTTDSNAAAESHRTED